LAYEIYVTLLKKINESGIVYPIFHCEILDFSRELDLQLPSPDFRKPDVLPLFQQIVHDGQYDDRISMFYGQVSPHASSSLMMKHRKNEQGCCAIRYW